MANGAALRGKRPYRAFHLGYPGSGKTGALVALLNAGYKLRVLDFDGNYNPLVDYADDRALANLDIVTLQDRMRNGEKRVEPFGIPDAFTRGLKLMQEWKYIDPDTGEEVNLGKSADWGLDTIVVVDSMTYGGLSAKLRAMVMNNKTPATMTSAVWGASVADWNSFVEIMKADRNNYHLIVNSHKQLLGPQDFLKQNDKDNSEAIAMANEEVVKAAQNDLLPTRIYPIAVTKNQATTIHGMLPTMLEFEKIEKLGKTVRVINTIGAANIDVKISGKGLKPQYPIETGLLDIFQTLGYVPPGF